MPRNKPLRVLPPRFADVESLLQRMPITREDGTPGLLASGQFGPAVLKELKTHAVDDVADPVLVTALLRDYMFLASAYLLEPCHLGIVASGTYAEGRDHLPPAIAVPLEALGKKVRGYPFLDYAHGYALNNWYRVDESKPLTDWTNLRLIRQFGALGQLLWFCLLTLRFADVAF